MERGKLMTKQELNTQMYEKLIQLGRIMNRKIKKGEENGQVEVELSKSISLIEKQLHDLSGDDIPGKSEGKCPHCREIVSEASKFCANCGTNVKEYYEKSVVYCSTCKAIISTEDHYCGICGNPCQ